MRQIGRVSATAVALDAPGRFRPGGPPQSVMRGAKERVLTRASEQKFRIALCVPMGGSDGIWGPSCLASARLAEAELNQFSGIAGRACELVPLDASNTAEGIEHRLSELVDEGEIDAIVGMHISSVRQRITGAVGGRIPYVYTCLYEGGETTPGVYAIGETSAHQLRPSIAWLSERPSPRRWMLVGNDYVWPRVSHHIARACIAEFGGVVAAETYVPFGMTDYSEVLDLLRKTRCDTVLISIVGQDAVEFNRAFARAGLSGQVLRLSCAIEENQLLAIGAGNTENLHVALGYFAALETDANQAFKERYASRFGVRAPALNSIGQSLYEGMHFLAALLDGTGRQSAHAAAAALAYASARDAVQLGGGVNRAPMYLACAEDLCFRVIKRF